LLAIALQFEPDPDGQGAAVRLIDNRVLYPTPVSNAAKFRDRPITEENPQ
jgi:hypothetical protein